MATTEMQLLAGERRKVTFPVEEITNILDGGKTRTESRRKLETLVQNDPVLKPTDVGNMSREERFTVAMKQTVYFYKEICQKQGRNPLSPELRFLDRTLGIDNTLLIHFGAFTPSIQSFGSGEQAAKWLPLALNLNITGTYAQTELGHGTFLRGLETVATYDRATQEFVINCPKISSMKWWPGDMGKTANHVLLMADLVIEGKRHGMHAFMVQIRDLTTHQPLPGVTVGDIGQKLAFDSVDNGFLYLQNVRIPRENLLSKYAEVDAGGTYRKKASGRMMYGSMVNLRVNLLLSQAVAPLSKACTIAIRYAAVRRQGNLNPTKSEVPILEYITQQHKLLPALATAYATLFATRDLNKKYRMHLKKLEQEDISDLPELHGLSAGMKSSVTEQCISETEIVRRACGGHGYSNGSGIPLLLTKMMASCTYEGENTVMYLQCARYLVKCMQQAESSSSRLQGSVAYLSNHLNAPTLARNAIDFQQMNVLILCFQKRSKEILKEANDMLQQKVKSGKPMYDAWNLSSVLLVNAAKAHIMQYIVSTSASYVNNSSASTKVKVILMQLLSLYALHYINNNAGDFMKVGVLTPTQCNAIHKAEMDLLTKLRPYAVGLVDAFDFSDDTLQSCLGAYDGNAYERLFEWAKRSPLNKTEVHEASYKYLKPYLLEGRDILEGAVRSKL